MITIHRRSHVESNGAVEQRGLTTIPFQITLPSTYLHQKVFERSYQDILNYLKRVRNVNQQDFYGWTALHYAVAKGDVRSTKLILSSKRANLGLRDPSGMTPLLSAIFTKKTEIIKLLLNAEEKLSSKGKTATLFNTALFGNSNDSLGFSDLLRTITQTDVGSWLIGRLQEISRFRKFTLILDPFPLKGHSASFYQSTEKFFYINAFGGNNCYTVLRPACFSNIPESFFLEEVIELPHYLSKVITLFHELSHLYINLIGLSPFLQTPTPDLRWTHWEEFYVITLFENALRDQLGLYRRVYHTAPKF